METKEIPYAKYSPDPISCKYPVTCSWQVTCDMWQFTALHCGLFEYLTAKDTCFSPTPSKYNITMSGHRSQMFVNSLSKIQENKFFFIPSIVYIQPKLVWALSRAPLNFQYFFLFFFMAKCNKRFFWTFIIHYSWQQAIHRCTFCQCSHHIISWMTPFKFNFRFSLLRELRQCKKFHHMFLRMSEKCHIGLSLTDC